LEYKIKVKNLNYNDRDVLNMKKTNKIWNGNTLQKGQIVKGTVKKIKSYGAFVELEQGDTGLIYIEDLSVARIKTPFERLKIGQNINVVVKSIDSEQKRITLSYKELLGTWEENAQKFKEGVTVKGIVRETEKSNNGIFIELTPNLVGLAEYKEGMEYGESVDVYIKKIIPDKHKVKLIIV
jgi:small subunit ribosomal protein S1